MAIIDNEMLWRQFGAAIDSLGNVLRDCPDELWEMALWGDQEDQWVAELQLYNLRHVQEHSAQLGLFLGQQAGKATKWVGKAS